MTLEIGLLISTVLIGLFTYQLAYIWLYTYKYRFSDSRLTVLALCIFKLAMDVFRGFLTIAYYQFVGVLIAWLRYVIVSMCFAYYFEKILHLLPKLRDKWAARVKVFVMAQALVMLIAGLVNVFYDLNHQTANIICEHWVHMGF